MLFFIYIGLIILTLPLDIPFVAVLSLLLPFMSYGLGVVRYRVKKGTWPIDKVKDEIEQSFKEGENEDGPYVVWEYEAAIFSKVAIITMVVLSLVGILLAIYVDEKKLPTPHILTVLIFGIIFLSSTMPTLALISTMIFFNRLRYQYGCHSKGYAYRMNDSRMKLVSFLSVTIGTADRNPTLTGSGLIYSGVGGTWPPQNPAKKL